MEVIREGGTPPKRRGVAGVKRRAKRKLRTPSASYRKRWLRGTLDVPKSTLTVLESCGARTFDDLLARSRADVAAMLGMGRRRVREVEKALASKGLRLARDPRAVGPPLPKDVEHDAALLTLGLSPRTAAKLHGAGILTVGDLVGKRSCDLQRLPRLGVVMHEEIVYILAKHGLSLAESVPANRAPPPVRGDPTTTIESLDEHGLVSLRTANLLRLRSARTAGDVATMSAMELIAGKGFGQVCLAEVRAALAWMGMALRGEELGAAR